MATSWVTFGNIWAAFCSNIWSHWTLTIVWFVDKSFFIEFPKLIASYRFSIKRASQFRETAPRTFLLCESTVTFRTNSKKCILPPTFCVHASVDSKKKNSLPENCRRYISSLQRYFKVSFAPLVDDYDSVTRFGEISPLWPISKTVRQSFEGLLVLGKISNLLWQTFCQSSIFFSVLKSKHWNKNLAIWSHWCTTTIQLF